MKKIDYVFIGLISIFLFIMFLIIILKEEKIPLQKKIDFKIALYNDTVFVYDVNDSLKAKYIANTKEKFDSIIIFDNF